MSAKDIEQVGDVVNGTKYTSGSAQDEYFKYMLLKEKLKLQRPAAGVGNPDNLSAAALSILSATSEKDEIELQVLEKLTKITESSPEFAQVVDITGTKDRYEQAKRLAETVYDRVRSEQILHFYTPSKDNLLSHFRDRSIASAQERAQNIAGLPQARVAPAANIAAGIFGGGFGGGAAAGRP